MTFPEWMVWYERAGYRSRSSYVNMMNGVRDLGVRVDRLWWTGERYANTIAEANGGMTGGERRDMVEVCKNAAGLVGFCNITDRSRRFEEYVSLKRPLTWYLVRVDLCTFFVWYNRQLLMHERWGIPWYGIERLYGLEVPRGHSVGRDGRHHGCRIMYNDVAGNSGSSSTGSDSSDSGSIGSSSIAGGGGIMVYL